MTKEVEVVVGPMNCGKSDELIRRLSVEEVACKQVFAVKPTLDTREFSKIKSKNSGERWAFEVNTSLDIKYFGQYLRLLYPHEEIVIGIDEAQLFDLPSPDQDGAIQPAQEPFLPGVVHYLAKDLDIKVIVAGLSRDAGGRPFGSMPYILAMAQEIDQLEAICTYKDPETGKQCNDPATETFRSFDGEPSHFDDPIVKIGAQSAGYESRCIHHCPRPGEPDSLKYPHQQK